MLFRRGLDDLALQQSQRGADVTAGVRGRDHRVDVAAFGRDIRVDEGVLVLLLKLESQRVDVLALLCGFLEVLAVDEADSAGRAHHGDLGGRPSDVDVAAHVLGAHDAVGAAVGLAGDDGDLGDGGLAVGVEQLGAAPDDAVVLLVGAGQEAWDVDEHDDRDVEAVAGPHEAGGFLGGVDVEAAGELGGWFATMPTGRPSTRPKPTMMFCA